MKHPKLTRNLPQLIAILAFLFLFSQNASCLAESNFSQQPLDGKVEYDANRYLLGPGDIVSYQVLHEADYNRDEILVHPDGHATFPGVGVLNVKGMTVDEVTGELVSSLKRTLVDPEVFVSLKSPRPGIVYLAGAVRHPGTIQLFTVPNDNPALRSPGATPLTRIDLHLTNILSNAGGVLLTSDLSNVQIKNNATGEARSVNLWKILKEGDQSQDVLVNPGDAIFVPDAGTMAMDDADYDLLLRSSLGPKTFPVRVIGEVSSPGVFDLDGQSPYLNTAIAKAGGYAPQAVRDVVAIRRFSGPNSFSTLYLDPRKGDITLRPNDVLYIAETKIYKSGRFMQEVAKIFSPFQTAAIAGSATSQVLGIGGWNFNGR